MARIEKVGENYLVVSRRISKSLSPCRVIDKNNHKKVFSYQQSFLVKALNNKDYVSLNDLFFPKELAGQWIILRVEIVDRKDYPDILLPHLREKKNTVGGGSL